MINKYKIFFAIIITALFLSVPLIVYSQSCPYTPVNDSANSQTKEQIATNEENQGEASAQTSSHAPDYKIFTGSNNIVEKILANNISSTDITGYDYAKNPNSDLKDVGDCELGSKCYMLKNTNLWNDPSIEVSNDQYKPAWAFLEEVKSKAEKNNDSTAVSQVNGVRSNYVASAFNKFLKPNLDFTSISGAIVIPNKEFSEALTKAGIELKDPYVTFYPDNGNNLAKIRFLLSYPEATQNSAWLAGCEFVVNSMLKPYKDAGLDTSEYEAAISSARKNYALSIAKEDKAKVLSFKYPINVLISKQTDKTFSYTIDTKSFAKPASGYKTKIYIKPASKKDDNVYILLGPLAEASYQFSWNEAISSGYVDSNGKKASVSSADYDLTYPQQYIVRIVTYDGDTEKDNVLATIQTQTEATISDATTVSDGNSILKISVKPAAVKQTDKVAATIEAINSTDPSKTITKVVFYACTGTASDVAKNDSSSCTFQNKDGATEDAVKAAFTLGSNLQFDTNSKATLSSSWDTSSSAIGNHALMAKAFGGAGGDQYIDGSKTAVTVPITNSEVGSGLGGGANSGQFSNLLTSQFSKSASGNPTGSSLKTTGDLATRIVQILLIVISALSVIAIIVGGVFYITSGGDQQKAEKGKKAVLYACIGIAIAVLVFVIEGAVLNIIKDLIK